MLDTLTVVINMTGLLLMVAPNPGDDGPTHVLMPATGDLPPHVAVLAFVGERNEHCIHFEPETPLRSEQDQSPETGLCFVDMDGWSLEPVPKRGNVNSSGVPTAVGAVNITHGAGGLRPIAKHLLSQRPGRRVRSRMTLHAGRVTNECGIADWYYRPVGPLPVRLANMVEWTIRRPGEDSLVLRRRRLDPRGDDKKAEILATLRPNSATGVVELLLFHVSVAEALEMATNVQRVAAVRTQSPSHPLHAPTGTRAFDADGPEATHFAAYYSMVNAAPDERPLPRMATETPGECYLSIGLGAKRLVTGLRTHNCMVASASPD